MNHNTNDLKAAYEAACNAYIEAFYEKLSALHKAVIEADQKLSDAIN